MSADAVGARSRHRTTADGPDRDVRAVRADRAVRFVMPGGVDDPTSPSGGNIYDRRMCRELPRIGWQVHEHAVAGAWPRPGAGPRSELARGLRESADGSLVLLDGLVACGVPDVVVPEADRLRLAVLVHLPLGDETGLAPAVAAELDAAERTTLRAAAVVVAPGEWAARRLVEHHGLDPRRVHAAAPGADPAPLAPGTATGAPALPGPGAARNGPARNGDTRKSDMRKSDMRKSEARSGAARDGSAPRLLCVASVTPRKGQHLLIEALASLAGLPWTCELVGGTGHAPAYAARLRELIGEHGLGERVHLAGPRSGPALNASYAAADLLVLASHTETYGMVATEALARGVPVVATAAGGLPEAVGRAPDGSVPGTLVPPGDPAALAAALRRWLTEPGERHRSKTAARRRRTALAGWETTSRNLARALEQLRNNPLEAV
ncbi:glycosyltransferase family 4 protein [Streptomyces pacificus]|uniref:D-inositol 3-phosphate glycosyltransferase n=1 Tax=Streptomyces pacificus TaxID=2705029 RepID=A0A6A0AXS3_9ACTN|nr:glycosyltransferase family 4 protein [Streptomyces pacificus]GFH36397.1 glycosyltransferase family 4 protein [Streptomyces pacificus]